ncbi:hypothetical protein IKW73_02150 [Candidatus Saccharibacteria bacterium]|nr:hypothetical protein [Candidatus Saccharibacteria bacterium]
MKKIVIRFAILAALAGLLVWAFSAIKNREVNINKWFVGNYQKGVDVSSYQEDVDFDKLKEQHIDFVYVKATEGSTHVDSSFSKKWADTAVARMPAGAYHYFSYESSGAKQAENFIKTVGSLDGRLIPAVDMELTVEEVNNPPEKDVVVRGLKAFLAVIEEKYGVKPLIYAQKDYWDKYLAEDFSDYPRWIRNVYYPVFVDAGDDWLVWQYWDKCVLEGYSGEEFIDMNAVNTGGLEKLEYKNGGA